MAKTELNEGQQSEYLKIKRRNTNLCKSFFIAFCGQIPNVYCLNIQLSA